VAPVRTDVQEEHIASIVRVKRISELGTTLIMDTIRSSETSVLTGATRRLSTQNTAFFIVPVVGTLNLTKISFESTM
jgi:hypothetical protein